MGEQLQLRLELQESPVVDEVSAVTAVAKPILLGILYALKNEVADAAGGYENLKLFMLPRLRRPGDGDIGICFEYAVHDALAREDPMVTERVEDALRLCNCPGSEIASILFGMEKRGALNLINTAFDFLTEDSDLLYGTRGRPAKLKRHITQIAAAFRKSSARETLPGSISGLWKADLFTGHSDTEKWIGTTLKINRDRLEGARGLRLGIVPASEGDSDAIVHDETKNLVICPLPYDRSFMQVFYEAWEVVVQFLKADAQVPGEANLPRPAARQVARYLESRREFPVLEVVQAIEPLAQTGLLRTEENNADVVETRKDSTETTTTLLAPIPLVT